MYFEPYFFSKKDQVLVKNTPPHISKLDDAVAAIDNCFSEDVLEVAHSAPKQLGILLSGGVDSSLLLALLNQKLPNTRIICFTVYVSEDDEDVFPSKEVSSHFGNQWVPCKLDKRYIKEHLSVTTALPHAGLYVTAANLALMHCLEECKRQGIPELWMGTGVDMMFGGGIDPKIMAHGRRDLHNFHKDFWKYSMELLLKRFYHLGSPDMQLLAEKSQVKLVTPFGNLRTILCARTIEASLFFKGAYDKYPVRALARQLGVPEREAFRPKQPLQESSGIFQLLEECMFDEIATLVFDGVSARRDMAYYKNNPHLSLELYIALKKSLYR